ncbi:MAG: FAD-dependent oxidoreductase [Chloroflexi bacterium]|nr:FAD-dependent oxidoreductase [Chloroflexota bacterium]
MYDLIIVGGGPAGMSAGIYAARHRLSTLLLAPNLGGQAADSWLVENYLGFKSISGAELVERFEEHLGTHQVERERDAVAEVTRAEDGFGVRTSRGKEFLGKAVIVCTGRFPRRLGIPGEKEFDQRGVAYCATCDAPLFADLNVAVIGGGDAALQAAAQLLPIASRVYLVSRREWRAEPALQDRIRGDEKLTALIGYLPLEIQGTDWVEKLVVRQKDGERVEEIAVGGVFVEVGAVANSAMVKDLVELNEAREIVVDRLGRTSVPGVFAAGDVTDIPHKQIGIAAGEGAKAFLTAYEYLLRRR